MQVKAQLVVINRNSKMSTAIVWLLLLNTALALLAGQSVVHAKRFFAVGERIDGDQLLLKDVQHSRPGGSNEPASVTFNYNIAEPISYIQIIAEDNISAVVKFSYVDRLVVGVVSLMATNESEFKPDVVTEDFVEEVVDDYKVDGDVDTNRNLTTPFSVLITIFGFNQTTLNMNPALLLQRDSQFEAEMMPYDDNFVEQDTQLYDNIKRDDLQVDIDKNEQATTAPIFGDGLQDKIIEIGERQKGDSLIFETYQTSGDVTREQINHTVTFYFIDSDYITYVKFVIFDHFTYKVATAEDYLAPVAEYSHYSPFTLKATITNFNNSSLFVQMFVYGYRGLDAPPTGYKPFLERTSENADNRGPTLTPLQRMQLLLLTGRSTTLSPVDNESSESEEDDGVVPQMRAEEMAFDRQPEKTSVPSAVIEQQRAIPQRRLYAMLGLMLFAVA